jgi:hypothetical protein
MEKGKVLRFNSKPPLFASLEGRRRAIVGILEGGIRSKSKYFHIFGRVYFLGIEKIFFINNDDK